MVGLQALSISCIKIIEFNTMDENTSIFLRVFLEGLVLNCDDNVL